jgi:hypothetical protein
MHADGHVRERAVRLLAAAEGVLSDRTLAVRLADHVPVIREAASGALLGRTSLESAVRIMTVMELMRGRVRVGDVRALYVSRLIEQHGESQVWAAMRASQDRSLRREAFRHSLSHGLIDVDGAVVALPGENDRVVRSLLSRVIAEKAEPDVVADVLLTDGTAEGRALGLVRLAATQIDPRVLEGLLVDTSVLVRIWSRTRWTDLGRDPLSTYTSIARDNARRPRVRARAYGGVLESGGTIAHDEALDLVRSHEPSLVKVGLAQLLNSAEAGDVGELFDVVKAGTNKEAKLASAVLIALRRCWSRDDLVPFQSSTDPELRRRAWWLLRSLGGWEQTLADLSILHDPDTELSQRGRSAAPPMYQQPTDAQRQRLRILLPEADLPRSRLLDIAVAAGIRDVLPERVPRSAPVVADTRAAPQTGWLGKWFRKNTRT